jgi:aspartate racemase
VAAHRGGSGERSDTARLQARRLIGTQYTLTASFYQDKFAARGIETCLPAVKDRKLTDRIIFDELVAAMFTAESRAYFTGLITEMRADGCEAVVLGCTEVPLVVTEENSPLPVLDSTGSWRVQR